ncbi:MAG: YidC/Oxa1 family membrane protein insertase, partial [Clostridia bacterium]|nr:YidC/Oxa1 family membrane protein insertase [Clostridia bacterium]
MTAFFIKLLNWIYSVVGNYGWSIVLFTLLIRMVLLPLDIKSKKSMRAMTKIQPKVQALQKKYANDKEKLNQKT